MEGAREAEERRRGSREKRERGTSEIFFLLSFSSHSFFFVSILLWFSRSKHTKTHTPSQSTWLPVDLDHTRVSTGARDSTRSVGGPSEKREERNAFKKKRLVSIL